MLVITTKEELKKAIDSKIESFSVEGKLAKDVKKSQQIAKLSKSGLAAVTTAVAAGVALAPVTGGVSVSVGAAAASGILGFTAVSGTAAAATGGVSATTALVLAIIALGGITVVLGLFKGYNVEYSVHPKKGLVASFTKK